MARSASRVRWAAGPRSGSRCRSAERKAQASRPTRPGCLSVAGRVLLERAPPSLAAATERAAREGHVIGPPDEQDGEQLRGLLYVLEGLGLLKGRALRCHSAAVPARPAL